MCGVLFKKLFFFVPHSPGPPAWEFMYGLMENAIYGGRVDNMSDLLVLRSYVRQIFNDSVVTGKNKPSKVIPLPCGNIPLSTRLNVSRDPRPAQSSLG